AWHAASPLCLLYCGRGPCPGVNPCSIEVFCVVAFAAALLAAHRAFIAAASCARRSGVRLSLLFTFLAALGLLTAAVCIRTLPARTADFLCFLAALAATAASSFCFSLASFFAPFCRRTSSRRIFLLRFLGLI